MGQGEFNIEKFVRSARKEVDVPRVPVNGVGHSVSLKDLVNPPPLPEWCSKRQKALSIAPELQECEPRYFLPLSALSSAVNLRHVRHQVITQCYYTEGRWPAVLAAVPELHKYSDILHAYEVSQIRLRCTREGREFRYDLSVKARLDPEIPELKLDLPVELSPERFAALAPFTTGGVLQKLRFIIPGTVSPKRGNPVKLQCEADVLLKCGNPPRRLPLKQFQFSLAELDVRVPELLTRVREGYHSFTFLRPDMDLFLLRGDTRRALRMSRLADEGFDDDARSLVEKLTRKWEKGG